MLPADRRLRRSDEFRRAVRRGRRAGSRLLVVHLCTAESAESAASAREPARVGFVVSRGVGGSVVRSQVTRRLRHLVRARLDRLPDGALVVVRALPAAAGATSADLGSELDGALRRLVPAPAGAR